MIALAVTWPEAILFSVSAICTCVAIVAGMYFGSKKGA